MDMDIFMDIHAKSVDMDMDMDGKFHIHGNPVIMSVIGRNACVQTFAKVVDSLIRFVDRCLWQVIPDLLQCILALGWFLALTEVCEMLEASHPTHGSRVVEVW